MTNETLSSKTESRPMTTALGDSVQEQILFMEAWLDYWKRLAPSEGAARMATNVIRTLKGAVETTAESSK